jgi:hypothetical protein
MDDKKMRGAEDVSRISLGEKWEVAYWTERFGVAADELREAVRDVGNSAEDVREYLQKKARNTIASAS